MVYRLQNAKGHSTTLQFWVLKKRCFVVAIIIITIINIIIIIICTYIRHANNFIIKEDTQIKRDLSNLTPFPLNTPSTKNV